MPAAYLTPAQAQGRLLDYSIVGIPTARELILASDDLDLMGGFAGEKYETDQPRVFPRSVTIRDDDEGEVPSDILDWVALTAWQLHVEDEPPVKSERLDLLSATYTRGKRSRISRIKENLLRFYRGHTGRIAIV